MATTARHASNGSQGTVRQRHFTMERIWWQCDSCNLSVDRWFAQRAIAKAGLLQLPTTLVQATSSDCRTNQALLGDDWKAYIFGPTVLWGIMQLSDYDFTM